MFKFELAVMCVCVCVPEHAEDHCKCGACFSMKVRTGQIRSTRVLTKCVHVVHAHTSDGLNQTCQIILILSKTFRIM